MNHNNDSNIPQSTFIDEGRGAPELPEKSGCSVGPENFQVPRTGVLESCNPLPVAMDYNFCQQKVESPGSNWTHNTSDNVNKINSPLKNVATGSFTNSFSVSGSESVNLSSSPQISSSVTLNNPPARKRLKLTENDRVSAPEDMSGLRRRILEYKLLRRRTIREKYAEHSAEYFYLQAGGNIMDYHAWRKRPPTPQLIAHLRTYRLDSKDENEDLIKVLCRGMSNSQTAPQGAEIKIPGVGATPVAISTTLPAAVAQLTQQGSVPGRPAGGRHGMVFAPHRRHIPVATPRLPGGTPLVVESGGNLKTFSTVSSSAAGSLQQPSTQEQIVEKAKQEAYVMQRILELQKEGLWTEKRLPKVMEPPRPKAHWDYLLEEMVWLAADFAQERKWKKAAAKKCARMVQKYFQEKALAAQRAEKAQELQLKRIASFVAKEIKIFWSNVEKLVEFKQQTKLEEERRRALDQQLSFIVDQTEKYSQQLAEGMRSHTKHTSSKGSSTSALPSDDEFCPSGAISSDDEETIAAAEKEDRNHSQETTKAEVEALQRESKMDLDEFLNELPANYLENRDKIKLSDNESENGSSGGEGEDSEFQADEDSSDDEDTIMEQEKQEGQKDHKKEIDDLKAESEMSIDELMKKYSAPSAGKALSSIIPDKEGSAESDTDNITEDESTEYSDEEDEGLDALVKESIVKEGEEDHRMEDAAAIAESIQPKGNTLSSTQVVTKVPFLLKHCLREYQHIGLDWLVTMEERRLNGILADEMGLGKTIQTIALLAHLACEKHDWGPHLIIVPTSVMLNWEMECKKWCPSFKILTYYGSIKERKLKRIGWTKPNAFHICITSYKLVIQDHHSFRRKKWKYLILDEAQNIKNFKSQRWQLLLNFQTQQRLLLTGTPLQNNLMELWSLMHFLMPDIFASHREFKEWFSNPVTGMIEGNSEYNENIIKRLHKVLRPFLLRRLKSEVEKQMPKKYEHVIMCRLSKRQRFLYDDFMSRAKTRETLATGNMLSVINILMQLRKVCNHPNLFEVRPTISPFQMEPVHYRIPSLVYNMLNYEPLKDVDLTFMNLNFPAFEEKSAFSSYQINLLATPRRLIEEIDSAPAIPPRCPPAKYRLHLTLNSVTEQSAVRTTSLSTAHLLPPAGASPRPDMRRTISQIPDQNRNVIPPSTRQRPILRVPPLQSGDAPAVGVAADPPLSTNGLGAPTALGARVALFSPLTPRAHRQLSSARTAQVSPIVREKSPELSSDQQVQAEFYQQSVEECLKQRRKYKLKVINNINERRCSAFPLYGADLRNCCTVSNKFCDILQRDVSTVDSYIHQMNSIFDRFIVYICGAVSSGIKPFVSHGSVWKRHYEERLEDNVLTTLKPVFSSVHLVASRLATHFPDPRLIQYDCGKLQTMDVLLRRLRSEQHRVLIFTQMTRMLDVLEAFLNFHGYIYLRLDGTTRIEQRQILMERFNNDSRIFAFILSTRSGGVGVNLTGADTVIFYDSDWNPTMDAQAQDRCHRIGQTRDVHIYRLISEKTVEENILKKANQKRMLGDVAIEGGNFTTAYFKSTTIQELFSVAAGDRPAVVLSDETEAVAILDSSTSGGVNLESALAQCEDEADVAAARTARAEAAADLAEFDENIPIEEQQQPTLRSELSKAELELQSVMDQLSPVERYAMRLVESSEAATSAERTAAADLERQRRDWQAARRAIAPLSPVSPGTPDDSVPSDFTFSREDADNQVWISSNTEEQMPMWCPPTPPQGDDHIYIDSSLYYLYEWNVMTESQLPPIYVKRDAKRPRTDTGHSPEGRRPLKIHRKDESVYAPRSLFERPSPAVMKMRRDLKLQKYRGIIRPTAPASNVKPSPRPYLEPENVPEWTVAEDMSLLQAIKVQGHTANWDLVSDMVNNTCRIYRSPRQCRNRYESVILPREEGKLNFDNGQKKQKKIKSAPKIHLQQKSGRPMRTSQMFELDNNVSFTQSVTAKYDSMKLILNKKAAMPKRRYEDQASKNPKFAAVLSEYGINYDLPPSPMEVATRRAERIAKEKQKAGGEQQAAARLAGGGVTNAATAANKVVPSPPPSSQTNQPTGSVSGVAGNITAARPRTAIVLAAQQVSTVVAKGLTSGTVTASGKPLNQAQIQQYRQQALLRQQLKIFQQTGVNQAGTLQAGVVTTATNVQSSVAQQNAVTQQRSHMPQTIARTVTEGEINALFKRQQAFNQQKVGQQTQVTQMFSTSINQQGQIQTTQTVGSVASVSLANAIAKAQTSTGIIGITSTPGSMVTNSAINPANMKMATPQQLRQLQLQQQLNLAQRKGQKVTQLAQVGAGTQVIVQASGSGAAHKNLSSGVVQQFQQVVRQPTTRVLPRHIQVVGSAVGTARAGNSGTVGTTGVAANTAAHHQVILSQVSAALQARQQQVTQQVTQHNVQNEHQNK